ncbi:hypothetical protein [Candidatus Igneacidithiobacillus taiwanensis]|uniref:hypothetical protein n=1 Tax=Candidatus Igneacidithiobacillus taiwanensis TaxID=1945924 RepID=UPI0028A12C75|nr:hypothetical protein [Candidatus Igneacidithiobacillus taiwanensis]
MPKPKVLRSAAKKFAVPMAAVERAVKTSMGEPWLQDRGRQMVMKYGPEIYGKSSSRIVVESSLRVLKRMID